MRLERRVCSRKTAADGRFEVAPSTAEQLRRVLPLRVQLAGEVDDASVTSMACSCNKGGATAHVHHFVFAPLLRRLTAEAAYDLALMGDGILQFDRVSSTEPER